MTDLERLVALEDIRTLCSLYAHHRDALDLEGLVGLFTEDAVCEFAARLGGAIVGREAIRRHFEVSMQRTGEGRPFRTMHAVTNPWIVFLDEARAQGRCFLVDFWVREDAGNPLVYLGIYDDEYRRVGRDWKIHRRRLEIAWPEAEASAGVPGRRVPWEGDASQGGKRD